MNTINHISFDLDGTLVDAAYTTWVWEVGVPELYAKQHNLTIAEATARIVNEYAAVGDESLLWYDLGYWFDLFDLPGSWHDLLDEHKHRIGLFPEVPEILERLQQHYDLIITSNAAREFVEMEIEATGISRYFSRIVSATSDF
nr:HAD family hydrolase [Deltaproteobacteria bacterium]